MGGPFVLKRLLTNSLTFSKEALYLVYRLNEAKKKETKMETRQTERQETRIRITRTVWGSEESWIEQHEDVNERIEEITESANEEIKIEVEILNTVWVWELV